MAKKRRPTQVDPHDKGTAATRQRLKRESTLDRLLREEKKRGVRDTQEMERAAKEIERVYYAVSRQLFAKASSYERVDGGEPTPASDSMMIAYLDRYVPWAKALATTRSPIHSIIIDVVVDDWTVKAIAKARRRSPELIRNAVLSGLRLYVDLAGWKVRPVRHGVQSLVVG